MAKIVESFENIGETPNSPAAIFDDYADLGFLQPGYLSEYRFASGVRLLEPAPNDGEDNGEVLVGDFDRPTGPTWGLDGNGSVETADDVPDGSAYIGRNIEENGTLVFGFDQPAFSVSAVVTAVTGELSGRVGVAAYDANGQLITGARIASVEVGDWDTNVISVTSTVPIAKVVFTGDYLILDELSFDTAKPNVAKGSNGRDLLSSKSDGITKAADFVRARDGNDKVFSKGGHDTLDGAGGKDKLHGGTGDDTILGGIGRDKLWGDEGQDSFLFREIDAVDVLKDFDPGADSILLSAAVFSELDTGTLLPTQFNDGSTPLDADSRILFDKATGVISYDRDGDGSAAATAFAKVAPGLALTYDNFFVV